MLLPLCNPKGGRYSPLFFLGVRVTEGAKLTGTDFGQHSPLIWAGVNTSRYTVADSDPIVVLLPGASTASGDWANKITNSKNGKNSVRVIVIGQGYIPVWTVLFGYRADKYLLQLSIDLHDVIEEYKGSQINIVAHSYATHMIISFLIIDIKIKIHNIFLLGSIIKCQSVKRVQDQFHHLYCDCVDADWVSHLLEVVTFGKYESTSVNGIQSHRSTVQRWIGSHSTLTSEDHFFEEIIPRILNIDKNSKHFNPKWMFGQHSITIYIIIYSLFLIFIVYFLLQSIF
jgi:hypothetical protein